jgi:two-component system, LytTR family, response regulator
MKVIIIDDEPKAIENLRILLNRNHPNVKVVSEVSDSLLAFEEISKHKPDVIFTDVNMPNLDGLKLTSALTNELPLKIFLTAYEQYAFDAIKNSAFDYLLKPIDIAELKRTVDKAERYLKLLKNNHFGESDYETDKIAFNVKDGVIFTELKDILYLFAEGSYTTVVCENNQKHMLSKNLKEFEKLLPTSHFLRCHNSYIVNKGKVMMFRKTEGHQLVMRNGDIVEVSKNLKDDILEFLK